MEPSFSFSNLGHAPRSPDLSELLAQGMGPELHWFPEDVGVSRLAAVLAGMANTHGGSVLIGITPRSGHLQGVRDPRAVVDLVFQAALLCDPPLVLPIPQIETAENKNLLRVTVPSGLPHVYSLEGRYLGRDGAQTNPLPARRLRQLLLERGLVQFESQIPPQATYDDLDPQKIDEYLAALQLPGNEPAQEILLHRGCLKPEGSRSAAAGEARVLRPTYAAMLLFGRHPQRWLPGAVILAVRFSGTTFSDRFIKQEIRGNLPDQLRQAEAFVRENLSSQVRLDGLKRQEAGEYPPEAVRELLVNAVAHRDYNLQGDTIHLNLFSDRIEVHSPGGLPGPVTLDNLLEARFSRNAVLVQALSDLGFVERLGYGLDRVMAAMRGSGLRPPRFEEVAGSFRVTLYGPEKTRPLETRPLILQVPHSKGLTIDPRLELNPRQEMAVDFLSRARRITNRDLQDLCPEVHPETLRRDLADLVTKGVLIKVGDKRSTYYILK